PSAASTRAPASWWPMPMAGPLPTCRAVSTISWLPDHVLILRRFVLSVYERPGARDLPPGALGDARPRSPDRLRLWQRPAAARLGHLGHAAGLADLGRRRAGRLRPGAGDLPGGGVRLRLLGVPARGPRIAGARPRRHRVGRDGGLLAGAVAHARHLRRAVAGVRAVPPVRYCQAAAHQIL